jgi:hypothetical protein
MQKRKVNPALIVVGAVLAICLAALLLFKQATAPNETINPNPDKIPAKGAGRLDRGGAGRLGGN